MDGFIHRAEPSNKIEKRSIGIASRHLSGDGSSKVSSRDYV
jgi:hypothetical protein